MSDEFVTPSGTRIREDRGGDRIRIEIETDNLPDIVVISGGKEPIHIEARRLAELGKT